MKVLLFVLVAAFPLFDCGAYRGGGWTCLVYGVDDSECPPVLAPETVQIPFGNGPGQSNTSFDACNLAIAEAQMRGLKRPYCQNCAFGSGVPVTQGATSPKITPKCDGDTGGEQGFGGAGMGGSSFGGSDVGTGMGLGGSFAQGAAVSVGSGFGGGE